VIVLRCPHNIRIGRKSKSSDGLHQYRDIFKAWPAGKSLETLQPFRSCFIHLNGLDRDHLPRRSNNPTEETRVVSSTRHQIDNRVARFHAHEGQYRRRLTIFIQCDVFGWPVIVGDHGSDIGRNGGICAGDAWTESYSRPEHHGRAGSPVVPFDQEPPTHIASPFTRDHHRVGHNRVGLSASAAVFRIPDFEISGPGGDRSTNRPDGNRPSAQRMFAA
jgi:hypothetical protein